LAAEPPRWRPARAADAGAIAARAAAMLGPYGEAADVYAERIALAPEGCVVLARGDEVLGHFLSHPWRRGKVPALNAMLGALPDDPDCWYVHDVAIAPEARGGGFAASALEIVASAARARGLDRFTLIAVDGADGFWRRLGFAPAREADPGGPEPNIVYMERAIGG
jgi:GNAT superfamily N-acetyltransferase